MDIKTYLENFCEENGIEFKESMFQQNTSIEAFIYFRHGFSGKLFKKDGIVPLKPGNPNKRLITGYVTKEQIKAEFGFFHELKSIN